MVLSNMLSGRSGEGGGVGAAVLVVEDKGSAGVLCCSRIGRWQQSCPIFLAKVNCTGRCLETLLMVSLHNAFIDCLRLEAYL